VDKPVFTAQLPEEVLKDLSKAVSAHLKLIKKTSLKTFRKSLDYHPNRLSPVDFLLLKVLHKQFDEESHAGLSMAIGTTRKTLAQVKRFLSHGSL